MGSVIAGGFMTFIGVILGASIAMSASRRNSN